MEWDDLLHADKAVGADRMLFSGPYVPVATKTTGGNLLYSSSECLVGTELTQSRKRGKGPIEVKQFKGLKTPSWPLCLPSSTHL